MTIDDPRSEAPGFEDAPCTDPTVDLSRSDHHALAPGADDGGADDPDPGAGAGRSGPNGNGNGNGASGGARSGAGDGPSPDAWSGGDGRPSDAPRRGDRRPGAPWPTDEELDALRLAGDPPADAVAIALLTAYGADAADENEVVARAIRSIMGGPASPDDAVLTWLTDGPTPPDWTDPAKVSAGQELFERWTLPIATCLFCAALPTTLAAPHGAAVLAATSHLGRPRQVAARLAGTGRMLFDALTPTTPCSLEPGGQGHTSILCVRLLHAVVRQALLAGRGPEPWDERHGTPINQEDLLGTLLVFSVTVLDALAKLGIRVQPGEAEAWLHTWSVVGSLMGVDEALLPLTLDRAPALAARVAGRQIGPGPDGPRLAEPLYREMRAAMPPGLRSLPDALTWHLVPEVAGLLDIPRPDRVARRCVRAAGTAATVVQRVPWLRRLAVGPGSRVGRRVLVRLMKEELGDDRPPTLVEASALRAAAARGGWTASRLRRLPGARRRAALDVQALVGTPAIPPLVDAAAIEAIATEGYPFWEPVEDMVIRNRRITTAYAELSRMLARTIAGPGGRWDTNWCTFASWTSATVGRHIATIPPRAARGGRGRRGGSGGPSPLPGAP
ncbi:MAG TPA: oxygenase MpaB family protein, partial [Acidimicrobiales bacterium]